MQRLFELHSNGAYSHTEHGRHIRYKFVELVRDFIQEHGDCSLVDLRLILSDALSDASVQESVTRRLTTED